MYCYGSDSDSDSSLPPVLKHTVDTSNATPDRELPCAQCPSKFTSKRDLMRHKERAPNHEYCKLHDMDFETWEDHGIHRVNNREHKTCEHCYQDFGSREGLNLHVAQLHKGAKSSICPYCDKKFKGGMAGLSMHIESNQCTGGMTRTEMNGRVVAVKSGRDPLSEERWAEIFRQPPTPPAVVQEKKPTMNELGITPENVESYWNELFGKYACPCGKKFDKKLSMLQHVQSIAHQRKTFLCTVCQKHFRSSSALIQHQESGSCAIPAIVHQRAADRVTGGLATQAQEYEKNRPKGW